MVGGIGWPTRFQGFFRDKMTYMGLGLVTSLVKFFTMTKRQTRWTRPNIFLKYDMSYFGRRLDNWCNIVGKGGGIGLFDMCM